MMFHQIICVLLTAVTLSTQDDILEYENEVNPDGSYKWKYITTNGITAEEEGILKSGDSVESGNEEVHGSYQYTAPDGTLITVNYVANEYGFKPNIKIGGTPEQKSASLLKTANVDNLPEISGNSSDHLEKQTENTIENS